MTQQEIIAKAYETYPDAPSRIPDSGDINYDQALKREGYIRALNELNKLPKISAFVARDHKLEGANIGLYQTLPVRKEFKSTDYKNYHWMSTSYGTIQLPDSFFPEITWKEEPVEVEIIIRKK